jgi:hypothetical protein
VGIKIKPHQEALLKAWQEGNWEVTEVFFGGAPSKAAEVPPELAAAWLSGDWGRKPL